MENLSTFAQMSIVAGIVLSFPVSVVIVVLLIVRSYSRSEGSRPPKRRRRPRRRAKAPHATKWPTKAANDD